METLFGRKKSRLRQSSLSSQDLHSVPYESVSAGPPVPVNRSTVTSTISAPITNPTLTANGTNLNIHSMQRSKAARERVYAATSTPTLRSSSPHASIATDDSYTLYSESADSISNPHVSAAARKLRQSGSSSGRRSPSNHDSFHSLPPLPTSSSPPPQPSASATLRPSSSSTTRSDNRSSRSTFQTESHSSNSHHHFPHLHRHGTMNDFVFPRPSDEEIEALFENVVRTRDLTNLPPLSIDQKWSMVESDERLRFNEEKVREEQAKKVPEQSRSGMIEERSPEWYLVKFMDKTITPKDASGLLVSLRGHELGCDLHHSSCSLDQLNANSRCRR
jgi:cytokinesis protein